MDPFDSELGDDFYDNFGDVLEDDAISAEEEGFMRGFMED